MYGIYVNCRKRPYLALMIAKAKVEETRSRNVLRKLIGKRVWLIETGTGVPTVRASAVIDSARVVPYSDVQSRRAAWILETNHDIRPGKTKVFYHLSDVQPVDQFPAPAGRINHGRSFTEF